MDINKTIKSYLDELSSNSPTPGGGNVAAFCGVLASSLGEMVCNLSIGKKKYADFENEAIDIKNKLESYKEEFISLSKKDNEAFNKVMEAFKLPKESDEQKAERREAIQTATLGAAEIPHQVINTCNEVIPLLEIVAEKGNQNSVSDAGVAASLISTAAQGAYLNVVINCSGLSNQITANEFLKKSEIIFNEVKEKADSIISEIIKKLRKV